LRTRHCDYQIAFAAAATPQLFGSGQLEWGRRVLAERDNLLAAMGWAISAEDADRAIRLLCELPPSDGHVAALIRFDPEPIAVIPGAVTHPGFGRVLLALALRIGYTGEINGALELAERAEAAEEAFGPGPGYLDMADTFVHLKAGACALTGDFAGYGRLYREVAERQQHAGKPGLAADSLAHTAGGFAWIDPTTAAEFAGQGIQLARKAGVPLAVLENQVILAMALAGTEPERARQLLLEVLSVDYGNVNSWACFAAGRLGDWPLLLTAAERLMDFERRNGLTIPLLLVSIYNFVARALVHFRPQASAVILGGARRLAEPYSGISLDVNRPSGLSRASDADTSGNVIADRVQAVRRETVAALTAGLGDERYRQLRLEGQGMDRTQLCNYTLTQIIKYRETGGSVA
jgi:hypothetical protein